MGAAARAARALKLGRRGEDAAADYLKAAGFEVIGRGFRARRGEVDLVCRRGGELFVVEVKTRSSGEFGQPAEAVDAAKRRALAAAAAEYRALSRWRGPVRFAVVSIRADGEAPQLELLLDPVS